MHSRGVCEDGLRHEPDVCSCTHEGHRTGYNEKHALAGHVLNPCLSGKSSSSDALRPTDCNGCCVNQTGEGTFGPRRSRHYIRGSAQLRACLVDLVHSIPHTDNREPKRVRRSSRATSAGNGLNAGPQGKASGTVKKSRAESQQEAKAHGRKALGGAALSMDRRYESKGKGKGKGKGRRSKRSKTAELVDDSVDGIA